MCFKINHGWLIVKLFWRVFFSFLQASRENWLLDLGDYRKRTWWYGTTISKAAIKWGVNINGPFYTFSKTVHKTFILLFYFLKDMQILPTEKKFHRNSSLDYRLGLIANYQMVAKELFFKTSTHSCLCIYYRKSSLIFKEMSWNL